MVNNMSILLSSLKVIVSAIFIFSSLSKLAAIESAAKFVQIFGFAKSWKLILLFIISVEFVCGSLLLTDVFNRPVLISLLFLMLFFSCLLTYVILKKKDVTCACFGNLSEASITINTILRNIVIIFLVLITLFLEWGFPTASFIRIVVLGDFTQSLSTNPLRDFGILPILILTSLQLMQISQKREFVRKELPRSDVEDGLGLELGQVIPEFSLVTSDGTLLTSGSVLNTKHPTVIFFVLSGCEPCLALMPEIKGFQDEFEMAFQTIVISEGDDKENLEKAEAFGVRNIFSQRHHGDKTMGEVSTLLQITGFPCYIVINNQHSILSLPEFGLPDVNAILTS